mmetsp:Transcript_28821/g.48622  ORF Transcript_28821/g.48622 Transcript_28821/m.48622 type:complete len:1741 (+) Transcript_28821:136-5358(+)
MSSGGSDVLFAANRDESMRKWHLRKELMVKGQELFAKLDSCRADETESLREVAISAMAIDKMIGEEPKQDGQNEQQKKTKKPTMKGTWTKWAMEFHSFSDVSFDYDTYNKFSGAVKEFVDEEDGVYKLMSLKYAFPAAAKPGEPAKPLSPDQKLKNALFMKEIAKVWASAKEELRLRLLESTTRSETAMKGGRKVSKNIHAIERNCLNALSIKRLKQWVEDDEDKRVEELKELAQEKAQQVKISHDQFVRHKDSLRIRLPPPDYDNRIGKPKAKNSLVMSFGGSMTGVRNKADKCPQTSVDLMSGSGLKYVHATAKGMQGRDGDLERSRKQLMQKGYLAKENFDEDDMDNFKEKVRNNPTLKEIEANQKKAAEDSAKAYEEWSDMKSNREQAVKSLNLIPSPSIENRGEGVGYESSVTNALCLLSDHSLQDVIEIGELLKKVDRSLFTEWYHWCNNKVTEKDEKTKLSANVAASAAATSGNSTTTPPKKAISYQFASAMWDYFEPQSCDVHSAVSSQVRDTFMKLLRPGFDYKAAFHDHAERLWRKRVARTGDENEEEKEKMISNIALGRKEMTNLLHNMGISMKKNEINALIDVFDANGDGVVTMSEFLSVMGPMRDKNSGALAAIKSKCCWRTTCKVIGMPNAYAVSEPTKEQRMKEGSERNGSERESVSSRRSSRNDDRVQLTGKTEFIRLANGEKRVRVEITDRRNRENMLRKYDVLKNKEARNKELAEMQKAEDDYDDDDDGYGSDEFDDNDKNETKTGEVEEFCKYSKWTLNDRRKALKVLSDMTKDARQEQQLLTLMKEGQPPSAPVFWQATVTDVDVGDEDDALTTSILMRWKPQDPENDLVSFYSLEYSGPVTLTSKGDRKYTEIFRDPVDAGLDAEFSLSHVVNDLSPGVSYGFRIRAFNGFGPGSFSYGVFTCRPGEPALPKIMKISSASVTLKWVFSNNFLYQMEQLKKLFELADSDGSNCISREELLAIFHDHESSNPELFTMLRKVLMKKGLDPKDGMEGLFDLIEGDDDGGISWDEFERFLVAGFTHESTTGGAAGAGASMQMSRASGGARTSTAWVTASGGGSGGSGQAPPKSSITYIIEQCESEFHNMYKDCMKSTVGECTISRLQPGHTYRFRVYGINVAGEKGPKSASIVVHTMLETPPCPSIQLKSGGSLNFNNFSPESLAYSTLSTNKVVLQWKGRRDGTTSRDQGMIDRMLGDWAGVGGDEGGVSVETAFANYDRDENGTIEPAELVYLLEDLGVEPTKERINEAFSIFDTDGDGVISFDEFKKWWSRDDVSYTMKRSEALVPRLPTSLGSGNSANATESQLLKSRAPSGASRAKTPTRRSRVADNSRVSTASQHVGGLTKPAMTSAPMSIVSYRGTAKHTEIAGLEPNSVYHFRLRYIGSRSNSVLSPPLVLNTLTLPCEAPTLVYLTPTTVRVKWYPPPYGAYKYCVQLKNNGGAMPKTGSTKVTMTEDGWVTMFTAQENFWICTTITPDSSYSVRVVGVNFQGALGVPSEPTHFRSFSRNDTSMMLTPKNANSTFSIECTGDVCVGDIILLTERLYARKKSLQEDSDRGDVAMGSVRGSVRGSVTAKKSIATRGGTVGGGLDGGNSVYSMSMSGRGGHLVTGDTPDPGSFIGERTLAAHVVKDNFKHCRISSGKKDYKSEKFAKVRKLWLEIIWQKANNEKCKPYNLKPGEVVERTQAHIEQFEVFRSPWREEKSRRSLSEDLQTLSNCFLTYDV